MPVLNFDDHELMVIANCINETLNAIDDAEMHTRVGANADKVLSLHRKVLDYLDRRTTL